MSRTVTIHANLAGHAELIEKAHQDLTVLVETLRKHPGTAALIADLLAPLVGQLNGCATMPRELIERLREIQYQAGPGLLVAAIDSAGILTFQSQQQAAGGTL